MLIEKQMQEQAEQDARLAKISPEMTLMRMRTLEPVRETVRNFVHTYSLIYCNENYAELRKIYPGMVDLMWVQNDLMNARATVAMLQIKPEN